MKRNQPLSGPWLRHLLVAALVLALTAVLADASGMEAALGVVATALATWAAVPLLARFTGRKLGSGRTTNLETGRAPRLGGLVLVIPLGAVLGARILGGDLHATGLAGGLAILFFVGSVDSLRRQRPIVKLLAQVLAGMVLLATGWTLERVGVPGLGVLELGDAAPLVFLLYVVLVTSAFTLSDGLDGLTVGLALVALGGLLVLGIDVTLVAACAAALLGFLAWNLPIARAGLGPAGRMMVGFLVATLLLQAPQEKNIPLVLGLVAYPLGDAALAVLRRLVRSKPILSRDAGHIHQMARRLLRGDRRALLLILTGAAGIAALAIAIPNGWFVLLYGLLWLTAVALAPVVGAVGVRWMLRMRRSHRELHLLKDYVSGRIRLADTKERVESALQRFATDAHLAILRIGDIEVRGPGADANILQRLAKKLEYKDALIAWVPNGFTTDDNLREEWRIVVRDVLLDADQRLYDLELAGRTDWNDTVLGNASPRSSV